jgi:hypothetical protein
MPTNTNKEHDHRKTQHRIPHDLKGISETGSLGLCVVSIDIGSNERMTMQNLQIPETAEGKIIPKWLFPPRFPDKDCQAQLLAVEIRVIWFVRSNYGLCKV